MRKEEFTRCGICGAALENVGYDSPLYCDKCIVEMERKSVSPEQLKLLKQKKW